MGDRLSALKCRLQTLSNPPDPLALQTVHLYTHLQCLGTLREPAQEVRTHYNLVPQEVASKDMKSIYLHMILLQLGKLPYLGFGTIS